MAGNVEIRLRFCATRGRFEVADETRAEALRAMASALTRAGVDAERAGRMLADAARATPTELRALQALVAEIAGGETSAAPARPEGAAETFDAYAERWFDDRERRGLSSVESDRGRIANHVSPLLGPLLIRDVSRDDLRAVVERLDDAVRAKALHWNTARKVWGLVTKLFSDACRAKVAALRVREDNPARDVQGPDRGQPTAKQWLYPSEVSALLACDDVPIRWRRLYALAAYLYPRPGELAALEWGDVDLEHGIVHIHQALDLRTGTVKATKTGITRKVPIHPSLAPLLAALRPESGAGRVVQAEPHANRKVAGGMPPLEDLAATLRDHLWRAGARRADLHEERPTTKRVTFYDLRSTGITWEVLAGTEPLRVQQRAGHREFSTTQGYIRTAEELGANVGDPFPSLPASLFPGPGVGPEGGPSTPSDRTIEHENSLISERPQRDLNPCYSLERAVSWAG